MMAADAAAEPRARSWMPARLFRLNPLLAMVALIRVLLPSFLVEELFPSARSQSLVPKRRPTSYLDGLKGLASWFVFNTHLSPLLSRRMGAGWGHGDNSKTFLQLPWVHFIHAGGFPIHIFFVINGAILSFSTVKAMDASPQDPAAMMKRLSLSIFRRPLRLFLPAFASTIMTFILVRFDAFHAVDVAKNDAVYGGWPLAPMWPARMPSFWSQLNDLFQRNVRMLRVLERNEGIDYSNAYNTPMWTSAVQYQGTLLIILCHAACWYIERGTRMITLLTIIVISIFAGQYLFLSFLLGWMLAEFNVWTTAPKPTLVDVESPSEKGAEPVVKRTFFFSKIYYIGLLIIGLYLASYPRFEPDRTYGFMTLYRITPPSLGVTSDLWHSFAAFLTVFSVGKLPLLQTALSGDYLRYIGRLAFGIYLTHLVATHIPGVLIFDRIWSITGRSNSTAETIGFAIAYLLTWFVNVWVADVWARTVEEWCTDLAEKVQNLLVTKVPK